MKNTPVLLLVLCILCVVPVFVHAARQVPGSVPDAQPLQPIPANVGPNIEHNVQSESSFEAATNTVDQAYPEPAAAGQISKAEPQQHVRVNWIMIGSFALAVGVALLAIRHRRE